MSRPYIKFDGGFVLTADSRQWIVGNERVYQSGDREGETYLDEKKYYSKLFNALRAIADKRLRSSEVAELKELILKVAELAEELQRVREQVEADFGDYNAS